MLALVPLLLATVTPSCPDEVDGPVVTSHRVVSRAASLAVRDGAGVLSLTDRLRPEGPGVALTTYTISLPPGRGVVVDGVLTSRHGRVSSTIVPATEAGHRFEDFEAELLYGRRSVDDSQPMRRARPQAALLLRRGHDGVDVHVAAPCGLGDVRVHLAIRLASDPLDDEWRFELPRSEDVHISRLQVPGRFFRRDGDRAVLVERTDADARGRVATTELPDAPARHVMRAELDLPRRLREEGPLALVFVVDQSVSFGAARLAGSVALAEEVLASAPEGSAYAVVTFARHARVAVSPWTPAGDRRPLRGLAHERHLANGSDVVGALELAKRVAADGGDREGRVVLLSDVEVSRAVPEVRLGVAVAGGPALTHVVRVFGEGTTSWERTFAEDGDALAGAAEASGGVLVDAALQLEEPAAALASYLLRPTRLERPRLVGLHGLDEVVDSALVGGEGSSHDRRAPLLVVELAQSDEGSDDALPAAVAEGGGLRVTGLVHDLAPVEQWRVEGQLWGARVRYPLSWTSATRRLLPALAAVNELSAALDDDDVMALSERSGAVSRVASRLGLPDWRPPPSESAYGISCGCDAGLMGGGTGGFGSVTCRCGAAPDRYDREGEVARWLEGARETCGASEARLALEFGSGEVLAVTPDGDFGPVERCYRERLWALRLDRDEGVTRAAYEPPGVVVVRLPS